MNHSFSQDMNDLYMYKFRTKLCLVKDKCENPSTCFDAHSVLMKRRVPKWNHVSGVFNYIPEPCQQWQRSKTCNMGKNCPLSHGWLEIIYHPLLYKTKLCKSERKNGICTKYGVYCAKAHSRCEIRSLVYIFGEDWKRHYDLSNRFGFQRVDVVPRTRVIRMKRYKQYRKRVGLAVPPKSYQMLDLNRFAHYLLEKQSHMRNQSRIRLERKLDLNMDALEFKSPYDKFCILGDGQAVTNFQQDLKNRIIGRKNIWAPKSWTLSPQSPSEALSNIGSPVDEEYESFCSLDTDPLMPREKDSTKSDGDIGTSGSNTNESDSSEFNYDRMPHNWFLTSCLEKASEVFTKKLL